MTTPTNPISVAQLAGTAVYVRETRAKLDLTQQELADAIGVGIASVKRWEGGKSKPSRQKIRAIFFLTAPKKLDDCAMCLGAKGGVPGNENVIGGIVMCDYCHALFMDASARTPRGEIEREAIARIVDPEAFSVVASTSRARSFNQDRALAKADAILALISPVAVREAGEGERLREAEEAVRLLKGAIRPLLDTSPYEEHREIRAAFNKAATLCGAWMDRRNAALNPSKGEG